MVATVAVRKHRKLKELRKQRKSLLNYIGQLKRQAERRERRIKMLHEQCLHWHSRAKPLTAPDLWRDAKYLLDRYGR